MVAQIGTTVLVWTWIQILTNVVCCLTGMIKNLIAARGTPYSYYVKMLV